MHSAHCAGDGGEQAGQAEGLGEGVALLYCVLVLCCPRSVQRDTRRSRPLPPLQVAFFLLGTINNLPYVVVNSSALILASRSDRTCT